MTQGPGHATELAAGLAERHDAVVCAGGDGTLFEMVNGLMELPADRRPTLGVVPLGTGNAFARDLGLLPWQWRKALQAVVGGHARCVDVGRVRTGTQEFHFINIVGAGFVTKAGLAARRFKPLGKAAYTAGVLIALWRLSAWPLRVEADGEALEDEALFVEVSNSRYTGTHYLMAPGARLDDGHLDLTLVRRVSRRRLLRLFPTIYDGTHVDQPEVRVRQARRIVITGPGLLLSADGEFRGELPAEIECLPGALQVFAPPGGE